MHLLLSTAPFSLPGVAPPPTLEHTLCLLPEDEPLTSKKGFDATLQARSPLPPFTWRREIPMQLPILYSMSSSGEVTLALHGWQSTFLQNCIVVGQSQHCQSRQICGASERVCARLCVCM